ncbi:MAG: type II toxin-antitoxin system HicB family antitoxin [Prevotellaceae bacterium]|jgi:predicted RNase H-like HicB family nuclease|nr:type II toxin-antitoxin system HicB family antitoxin [Prevotellaceae bacterium]
MKYTAIIEKTTDEWYIAYCAEVPGANSQGKTIEDTKNNLKEAISLILESEKKLSIEQAKDRKVFFRKIAVL